MPIGPQAVRHVSAFLAAACGPSLLAVPNPVSVWPTAANGDLTANGRLLFCHDLRQRFAKSGTVPTRARLQGSAKRRAPAGPGLVNIVAAVAYHLWLAFPAAFTQPRGSRALYTMVEFTQNTWAAITASKPRPEVAIFRLYFFPLFLYP